MTIEQLDNLIKWGLTDIIWPLGPRQPNLEELLEFAVTKDKSISLSLSKEGWAASTCNFDFIDAPEMETMVDPDPKIAVYKLLEKILA